MVNCIAVDPQDPKRIYVVDAPGSGGSAVWRSDDEGHHWECISDELYKGFNHMEIDAEWIAANPRVSGHVVLLGRWSGRVCRSLDFGRTWSPPVNAGSEVLSIVFDARTAEDPATTEVYVGTRNGLRVSHDGGLTFEPEQPLLAGWVRFQAAGFNQDGTADFYAGLDARGVWHSRTPAVAGTWQNLSALDRGLPARTTPSLGETEPGGFLHRTLVAVHPGRPARVYALTTSGADGHRCEFLHTSDDAGQSWHEVADFFALADTVVRPKPLNDYCMGLFVAPHTSGTSQAGTHFANDVLAWTGQGLSRSIDGGRTWHPDLNELHVDQHWVAFAPSSAGAVPVTYEASDGGVSRSTRFSDRTFDVSAAPTHFNHDIQPPIDGLWENRNHGKQSVGLFNHASHGTLITLNYLACQDTWVSAGGGPGGWRNFGDGDAWGAFAVAPSPEGVRVWTESGVFDGWPGSRIDLKTDDGGYQGMPGNWCTSESGKSRVAGSTALALTDGTCLIAGEIGEDLTAIHAQSSVPAAGQYWVRVSDPAAMAIIVVGAQLAINEVWDKTEVVTVLAVNGDSFEAMFGSDGGHPAGAAVMVHTRAVLRSDANGICTRVSQDFDQRSVIRVSVSPDETEALAVTQQGNEFRLWRKPAGAWSSDAVWTVADQDQPDSGIASMTIKADGTPLVLLRRIVGTTAGATPLFRIEGNRWIPVPCTGLPGATDYRSLVSHPSRSLLYAAHFNRVFEIFVTDDQQAEWTDISDGLPGDEVDTLWAGRTTQEEFRYSVLRAGTAARALWEADITVGANPAPATLLHVRDNYLDHGRFPGSPWDVPNPYRPSERLFHFDSPDIRIDHIQDPLDGQRPYFQTGDADSPFPIRSSTFEQLQDLPPQVAETHPVVHVQVRNRGAETVGDAEVWVLACPAGLGLPALSTSSSRNDQFDFWSQFTSGGINPSLPADSPWRPIGPPALLRAVDATTPQVASFTWPVYVEGGQEYALLCFVHSKAQPLSANSFDVDEVVRSNRQVGLRNVTVLPAERRRPLTRVREPISKYRKRIEVRFPIPRDVLDIIIDVRGVADSDAIFFELPPGVSGRQVEGAKAVNAIRTTGLITAFGELAFDLLNFIRKSIGLKPLKAPGAEAFARYRVPPGGVARLQGIQAKANSALPLWLSIERDARARYGQIVLQQRVGKTPVAATAVYLPDTREPTPFKPAPRIKREDMGEEEWRKLKLEFKRRRYLPEWMQRKRDQRWQAHDTG